MGLVAHQSSDVVAVFQFQILNLTFVSQGTHHDGDVLVGGHVHPVFP